MSPNVEQRRTYVAAVLASYTALPETPARARIVDRRLAEQWYQEAVPVHAVRGALLLGQARRLMRPPDLPRLGPIRSLYYFVPILDEVLNHPLPAEYLGYLESKLARVHTPPTGASSEKRVSS